MIGFYAIRVVEVAIRAGFEFLLQLVAMAFFVMHFFSSPLARCTGCRVAIGNFPSYSYVKPH